MLALWRSRKHSALAFETNIYWVLLRLRGINATWSASFQQVDHLLRLTFVPYAHCARAHRQTGNLHHLRRVMVDGDRYARIASDIGGFLTVQMFSRYPEQQSMPFPMPKPEDVCIVRVTPVVISVLDYTKGFAHTDLVSLPA